MSEERYQHVMNIFLEAADLDGAAREAFIDLACQGDDRLRRDVERLLAADQDGGDLFEEERLEKGHEILASALGVGRGEKDLAGSWSPSVPEKIGPYRIVEKIGEGGMGTVYLAEQDHPQRRVALKMIRPGLLTENLLKRFRFEADVLGRLRHPGIAQIYGAGEIDAGAARLPYFAMEYVEGRELRAYAEENDLDITVRIELVARICDAVHHAHQRGIVHRDLKPENLFVVDEAVTPTATDGAVFAAPGQPKVLDFGVARATDADIQMTSMQTDTGQLIGTIAYMSPEQVAGASGRVDERSDIYSLGVILYELLAGRLPYDLRKKPIPEAARIIQEDEPTRLGSVVASCRGDVDTIVGKAMEKDRTRRYATAAALASDLRHYLADEPIAAHPPSAFYQLKKFTKRHKGLVAGLVLSFLILLAGSVTSLNFGVQALRGEKRALESKAEAQRAAIRLEITAADAVGENDPLRGLKHLEAVPPEFRGWEWRHLYTRFESHLCEFMVGETSGTPGRSGVPKFVVNAAFGPEGNPRAAFEGDEGVDLVDLLSGEIVAGFRGAGALTDPVLSADGSLLAFLNKTDGTLIVENVRTGTRLLGQSVEPSEILDLRFSPDSSLLAVGSVRRGALVIDIKAGRTRFSTAPFPTEARKVAFSSDGSRMAVIGGNFGDDRCDGGLFFLYIYSIEGERLVYRVFGDGAVALAVAPDGQHLAVGHFQRMISIFDASTLEVTHVLHGHTKPVSAVAFSPDSAHLASASIDGTTRVWNLLSGTTLRVLTSAPTKQPVASLVFSPDSEMLVAANRSGARVWAWRRDARLVLDGHRSFAYTVVFSPDGRLIASSEWDDKICLWDALTGKRLATLPVAGGRAGLAFNPDGSRLLGSQLWDPATGDRLTDPRSHDDERILKAFAGITKDELVWAHFVRGGAQFSRWNGPQALSSDRSRFAKAYGSGEIQIRETAATGKTESVARHDAPVLTIAFSPDGKKLALGDIKGVIKVWDLVGKTELATMREHQGEVFSVNFSPDGSRIASGGNDGTVILWDGETFERVAVLRGHGSYVHSVAFSPDGTQIASASGDRTVRVWDTVSRTERFRQIGRAEALRIEVEPMVDDLLRELPTPMDVADRLRAAGHLDDATRGAVLRLLLEKCASRDE